MTVLTLFTLITLLLNPSVCFVWLTIYLLHHTWCYLIHVTIFSALGQCKIARASTTDWREVHEDYVKGKDDDGYSLEEGSDFTWEDVVHFVFLPNYKVQGAVLASTEVLGGPPESHSTCACSVIHGSQEDLDILREAIDTIANSTIAATQVTCPHPLLTFTAAPL